MPKIAILGDIFVDIATPKITKFPQWNEVTKVSEIDFLIGGSACNTARYLGGCKLKTHFCFSPRSSFEVVFVSRR